MPRRLALVFSLAAFICPSLRAADSDSERLARLERAVQLLQERNAALEKEVSSLKAAKKSSSLPSAVDRSPEPPAPEGKAVAEKTEAKEARKPVSVAAGGSELKLTLGGFIQTQFEAGDVFARRTIRFRRD